MGDLGVDIVMSLSLRDRLVIVMCVRMGRIRGHCVVWHVHHVTPPCVVVAIVVVGEGVGAVE